MCKVVSFVAVIRVVTQCFPATNSVGEMHCVTTLIMAMKETVMSVTQILNQDLEQGKLMAL